MGPWDHGTVGQQLIDLAAVEILASPDACVAFRIHLGLLLITHVVPAYTSFGLRWSKLSMDLIKQFVRQYWFNILASSVFLAGLIRYVLLAAWKQHGVTLACAVFGLVCVVASDEVVEWTGRYGWSRQQWWQYPGTFVRFAGSVVLVVATVILFRR